MRRGIIALAIVALIVVGALALTKNDKKTANSTSTNTPTTNQKSAKDSTQSQQSQQPSSNDQSSNAQNSSTVITYSDSGFSPASMTVKSGDTITVKNTSTRTLQFDSDPHPAHTDNTELNVGTIAVGQSQSFTVTKKGNFGYHNHLNSGDTGTLIVQ